jgi:hypothetical protein
MTGGTSASADRARRAAGLVPLRPACPSFAPQNGPTTAVCGRRRHCPLCDPGSALDLTPSVSNKRIRRYLNSHRPSVASECDGRNRGSWLPSRVGWFAALAYVSAAKSRSPRIGWPFRLLPSFVPQLPLHGPARDSNVCICGRSRSDRARCAPVVHWSEQSCLKNVPYLRHFDGGARWVHFSFICSAPGCRC